MIRTEQVHKYFSNVHAVNDLSLEVRRGEIFGLLGPNGAGKSTTIRMIVNIIQPDSGSITYDGNPFSDDLRQSIGYLPEERGLYQKSMILETILHFGRLKGLDRESATKRAVSWLERFGLGGSEKRKIEELSKGNQQKVQIIIALLHEPEYVILDEPSSGLDPVNQELLREIVEELRGQKKTIIYSTHQMDIAERLCDRIALINKGQVVLEGEVEAVRQEHGGNTVVVEYEGEGGFLTTLPQVVEGRVMGNQAELVLRDGAEVNDLFDGIGNRIRVGRIERVRPSLNAIFIQTVGAANAPQEMLKTGQRKLDVDYLRRGE
ncbi:MAG: ATP-binding cassette domain-containing protein [Ignavibacteriae bacterium]|nr:ATP-binding cassette domain-containing protein [Ignavibacteriota bacterium]MCB9215497.1 ATP-binding cassette domain-containing protein [Ignavibacteria bacterium]